MLYLNGDYLTDADAHIDPSDRGFLLGDGFFTTLKCEKGIPQHLGAHFKRLLYNANALHIYLPVDESDLSSILSNLLKKNQLSKTEAAARITVTRGISHRGLDIAQDVAPTVLVRVFPAPRYPETLSICLTRYTRNETSPLKHCKLLAYPDAILARYQARQNGCHEGILTNTQGELVCASSANLYIKHGDTLLTPSLESGALPGILRQQLFEDPSVHIEEARLTPANLSTDTSLYLSNSLMGLRKARYIPI